MKQHDSEEVTDYKRDPITEMRNGEWGSIQLEYLETLGRVLEK